MNKRGVFMSALITMCLWGFLWLDVVTEETSRKLTSMVILETVSNRVLEVDSRIYNTLQEYSLDNQADGVFLLSSIDDDFSLVERGKTPPIDLSAIYYPVSTSRGDFYLRVDNRYFLENSKVLTKYGMELSGYAILGVPKDMEVSKGKLRSAINLSDDNYLRYRIIEETTSPYNLILVAYTNKPIFHRLIYPTSFIERFGMIILLLMLSMVVYSLTNSFGCRAKKIMYSVFK